MGEEQFAPLLETVKRVAAALRDADVPFMLAGGLASWALGGPGTEHDVDVAVKPEDADRARAALEQAGMAPSSRRRTGCSRPGTAT